MEIEFRLFFIIYMINMIHLKAVSNIYAIYLGLQFGMKTYKIFKKCLNQENDFIYSEQNFYNIMFAKP